PALGHDELTRLSVKALAELDYGPTTAAPTPPTQLLPLRPGVFHAPADAHLAATPFRAGTAEDPLPAGEYSVRSACVGEGHVTVVWEWTGGTFGGTTIDCGGLYEVLFTAPVPGAMTITVTPD